MHYTKALFFNLIVLITLYPLQIQAVEEKVTVSPYQGPEVEDVNMGLFINLTQVNNNSVNHAIDIAREMMSRGHPVVFYLNGSAVKFASEADPLGISPISAPMAQKTIPDKMQDLIKDGAIFIVSEMWVNSFGIKPSELLDGVKLSNPDLVSKFLFDPKYKTISW